MSKKLIALTLAVAFALPFVAPAQAATVEELQALINSLNQQIAALQQQLASLTGGSASTGTYCFTTDLKKGMTSNDVKNLQIVLNKDAATQVATTGAGSPGNETTYFGALTEAAVKKYQAANGISPVSGYVGSLTRASLNAKYCNPVTPPTTAPSETTTTTVLSGTEGTLTASVAPVYIDTPLKWGTSNQTIYGFKVKAMNSDIAIKRIFVKLAGTNLIPWKNLSYISLYEGDNALKGLEVTKANLVENEYGSDYDVYFDGLNTVIPKGTEKTFTVKVSTLPTPENTTNTFDISLPANGVRGVDALGLNVYNGNVVPLKTIAYESTRTTASVSIRNNSGTPAKGIILGSKDNPTKDATIFKFDIKASGNDATLKKAGITLKQSAQNLITGVYLFDEAGNRLASAVASSTSTGVQPISFTDLNVSIAKDTIKTFTVKVDLAKIDPILLEGAKITDIKTDATSTFQFIDANDNIVTSVTGSATGNDQVVYTAAPVFALSQAKLTIDPNTSTKATAQFVFTVKGAGDTVYIASSSSNITLKSSNNAIATTSGDIILSASKGLDSTLNYYEIGPEETVTFTVEAAVKRNTNDGLAYFSLDEIKWDTAPHATSSLYTLKASDITDLTNWKTNSVYLYQ